MSFRVLSDVDGVVADLIGGGFARFLDEELAVCLPINEVIYHNDMGRSPGLREIDDSLRLRWPEPGPDGGLGGAFKTFMKDRDVYGKWVTPIEGAVDGIAEIRRHVDLGFVTALMKSARDHFRSKMEWIERYFPGIPIITCPSELKCWVSGDYAIDDRYDTCSRWEKNWKSGLKRAMLFRQPWNEAPVDHPRYDWPGIVRTLGDEIGF